MENKDNEKIIEWCGCLEDKERTWLWGHKVYVTPDNEPIDYLSTQLDTNFYEKHAFPKLFQDRMGLNIFTFYDDLNDRTFWFVHIVNRSTYVVEAASVVGTLTLAEAQGEALLMYIEASSKKEE